MGILYAGERSGDWLFERMSNKSKGFIGIPEKDEDGKPIRWYDKRSMNKPIPVQVFWRCAHCSGSSSRYPEDTKCLTCGKSRVSVDAGTEH